MRKAINTKNGKEKQKQRKKKKVLGVYKEHTIIYNLIIILEKHLKEHITEWEEVIKNDEGYLETEQTIILNEFLTELNEIKNKYEDIGFKIVDQAYIELENVFEEVVTKYKIENSELLTEREVNLIKSSVKMFSIIDALRQNITDTKDPLKKKVFESIDLFQNYITFFRNEVDKCKARVIFTD